MTALALKSIHYFPHKTKYSFRSGNLLLLPKSGAAPMLFLEFIRNYSTLQKRDIRIKVSDSTHSDEEKYFCIRMEFESRDMFADAVNYINSNI